MAWWCGKAGAADLKVWASQSGAYLSGFTGRPETPLEVLMFLFLNEAACAWLIFHSEQKRGRQGRRERRVLTWHKYRGGM